MTLRTVALCGGVAVIVAVGVWTMLEHGGNRTASAGPTEWKAPARPDEGRPLSPDAARSARAAHYQEFATLAQTRALSSYFARKEALYALAGRSDAGALRSLVSEANRIHDQRERLESLEILLTRFVEIDPEDALRAALNMDRAASAELVPAVIGAWSRTDLAAAATASKELPTPVLKAAAGRAILARHAAGDAQQVRQLAAELGVQEEADSALFDAHAGDALSDPHRALQAALAQGNSVQQQKAVGEIARAWAQIAPDEAWDYAAQLTDPAARLAFQDGVIEVWGTEQPSAAFARIVELPTDWQRTFLLRRVTAELALRDPRLAVEMVKGLPTQESEQLQNLVAAAWSRTDPTGAAQWIQAQGQASLSRLAYQIAAPYVTQKPDEALAWALRVSRSPGKNLWSHMVGIIAEQNPEGALQLALSAESPAQRTQALSAVIGAIAARDPALAMSQLEKLPPGQMRTQALTQIGMRVAEGSPERSLEWLKGIEDPQARRQVAQQVVGRIAQRDDAAATRLLDRVPDDLRGAWIRGIGNAYVNAGDFEQGAQWAKRFQDDPIYVSLVGTLTSRSGEQQDSERPVRSDFESSGRKGTRSAVRALGEYPCLEISGGGCQKPRPHLDRTAARFRNGKHHLGLDAARLSRGSEVGTVARYCQGTRRSRRTGRRESKNVRGRCLVPRRAATHT